MTLEEYQRATGTTALYPSCPHAARQYVLNGLVSEVGEVAGVIKRKLRDGTSTHEFMDSLSSELGDVFWYLARVCAEYNLDLEEIAEANLAKLSSRHARGTIRGKGDKR